VTVFTDHLVDADALAARLEPFAAIVLMRERTPISRALIERLPNLRLIATSGMWNAAVDLVACEERGIVVSGTQTGGADGAGYVGADLRARAADCGGRSRHSRRPLADRSR